MIPYASDTFVDDPAACPTIDPKTAGKLTGAVQVVASAAPDEVREGYQRARRDQGLPDRDREERRRKKEVAVPVPLPLITRPSS